jgi:hypothetical protein
MVTVFIAGLASIVTILVLVPPTNAMGGAAVTAILGLLGSVASGAVVAGRVQSVRQDMAAIDEKVNGRMSELISKVPAADRPAVGA